MQGKKPYNRSHAEALLTPCDDGNRWVINELGVWPAIDDHKEAIRLGLETEYKVLCWKPVMVFKDDQDAPDCKAAPALPFPFHAKDLAAFMQAGVGAFVADHYGEWEDGPDEEAMADIDPGDNYARQAVSEAFNAFREAKRAIGCPCDEAPDTGAIVRELLKQEPQTKPQVAPEATHQDAPKRHDVLLASGVAVAPRATQEQRQADRWRLCIDAGLTMPKDTYTQFPRGIREIAKTLGISRQALAEDLNKHRERLFGR